MSAAVARVRRTFIEYPVQPEFMDLSFMDEEEDESNLRTQSDPTGANADFAQPRSVLVPMRCVAEEGAKTSGPDASEDPEDEDEDSEDGELLRTQSVVCASQSSSEPQWGFVGAVPWPSPYCAWGCAAPEAPPFGCATPEPPPFGQLHCFHREALQFCTMEQDLRTFTKGRHFHGRLSVVTEGKVRKGGVHRYMVQLVGGSLSRADGIGFIFAHRLPCTKDIQKIVSVYLNQQGEIGMRLLSKTHKGSEHVCPLELGDWVELSVDLDNRRAAFGVWRCSAWGLALASSAHLDFGDMAHDCGKDVSTGYLGCVVKNCGACMRLGS
mmetsp:Transcript_75944/g.176153  ORF Transcript_75944/g.176153 Transcript_75944/m.176153 type:complete len:324 (-) Transcript_75944:74-1045(-)